MNRNSAEIRHILSINSGSSSLKFGLYYGQADLSAVMTGSIERIGLADSVFSVRDDGGEVLAEETEGVADHEAAIQKALDWIEGDAPHVHVDAAGHRLVHGGGQFTAPHVITPDVRSRLEDLIPLAPEHLPRELSAIEVVGRAYPDVPQVACFDTSFHRHMPLAARRYALPASMRDHGIIRYGFHGLSYEYIVEELRRDGDLPERLIIAHLGNGASMVAVRQGTGVETTMGFTPAGGLVMSTRSGDLDPGIIPHLLLHRKWDAKMVNELVNQRAGLLAVSGRSGAMKDLLEWQATDTNAAEAVEMFCYQAKKYLGSLTAVLGGVDMLVFTGGIGEKAPEVRQRICEGMDFAGIRLDPAANEAGEETISASESGVKVRVMKTNEELMIARHTGNLLRRKAGVSHEKDKD